MDSSAGVPGVARVPGVPECRGWLSKLSKPSEPSTVQSHPHFLFNKQHTQNKQGDLAFGKNGRPASAGKPRIPGDAVITFDVEIVGLPGKEPELIELIGDD